MYAAPPFFSSPVWSVVTPLSFGRGISSFSLPIETSDLPKRICTFSQNKKSSIFPGQIIFREEKKSSLPRFKIWRRENSKKARILWGGRNFFFPGDESPLLQLFSSSEFCLLTVNFNRQAFFFTSPTAVSYTHLTLPTNREA